METECLLVLAPGFGISASDMRQLAEAAQAHAPFIRLWAVCMDLDYQSLMAKVMEKHPGASFAESAAGVTFSPTAFKSVAGLILLASTFDGRYMRGVLPSLEDWGRPVLQLNAELDGQIRWPWLAPLAADAAVMAQKAGPVYAAANQPFILVPNANHAQTSNGRVQVERGDMAALTDYAAATEAFAKAIAAFLTSHESVDRSSRQAATDELLLMVRKTAELIGPYFMASGKHGRQGGPEATASLDLPDTSHQHQHQHHPSTTGNHPSSSLQQPLLQGARREAGSRFSAAIHPGVVQKAERFVAAAQLRLCSSLPKEVLGRLRIVVQIHTEVETLLLNQPRVREQPDGSVVVVVHALLALPNVVRPGSPLPSCQPAAPEYWLKLKRPQAIADALGLEGAYLDGVTAAALNKGALDAAVAAVAPAAAQRYKECGRQVTLGHDDKHPDMNAEKFIKEAAMHFEAIPSSSPTAAAGQQAAIAQSGGSSTSSRGAVSLTSPVLTSPSVTETKQQAVDKMEGQQAAAAAAAADDPYMHRFLGNWYAKVWSVAQAMEWVMLDSLRDRCVW
eukprot:gene6829-7046_t